MSIIYYWLLFNLVFVVVLYIGKKRMDYLRNLRDSRERMNTPLTVSAQQHHSKVSNLVSEEEA